MTEDGGAPDTDIRQLDETTVERIAAGEVVERPASAVKELVENAIDAGADSIDVAVDGDGTERVRVRDDGRGMSEADVRAAVRAHTTSKLDGPQDLERGFATLGFRGEALHTIGAVSRLTIRTKPAGADGAGTELVYEGGAVTDVSPCGCPEGTTVLVEDLFYNTPARKEYLTTEATEFAHVTRTVRNYALANPDVAVSLTHDGRETFATDGKGSLRAAVMAVYGRDVAEAMLPVETDPAPDAPLDAVGGLVSHPETNRSTAEYCSTFVNGRYVESETVRDAVLDAYGGQLAGDRYPFAVLDLELPPGAVDVNVHPRKMAVRFESPEAIRDQVRSAVRDALVEAGLVRTSAPRGASKADETAIDPASRDATDDRTEARAKSQDDSRDGERRDEPVTTARSERPASTGRSASTTSDDDGGRRPDAGTSETVSDETGHDDTGRDARERSASGSATRGGSSAHRHDGAGSQRTLTGEGVDTTPDLDTLPSLTVLGQFDDTYLVCEGESGLLLVDQHAADERINYERLRAALTDETTAQELATPVELSVTAGEAATLSAHGDALTRLGFHADPTDDRTVRVTAVPAAFSETLPPETLRDVLAEFVAREAPEDVADLADGLLADLACHPSITGNTSLTEGSALDLLRALDDCENPYACPHGRPVVVSLDRDEIDARFERDYPGH